MKTLLTLLIAGIAWAQEVPSSIVITLGKTYSVCFAREARDCTAEECTIQQQHMELKGPPAWITYTCGDSALTPVYAETEKDQSLWEYIAPAIFILVLIYGWVCIYANWRKS